MNAYHVDNCGRRVGSYLSAKRAVSLCNAIGIGSAITKRRVILYLHRGQSITESALLEIDEFTKYPHPLSPVGNMRIP